MKKFRKINFIVVLSLCASILTSPSTANAEQNWLTSTNAFGDMAVMSVSAGGNYSCAVSNDGSVNCWGHNGEGRLGDGSTTDRHTPTTVDLGAGMTAVSISAGAAHMCAVLNDGSVKCWGYNLYGRLGDGTTTDRWTPTAVDLGVGMTAVSVSAGGYHSCAVFNDGSLKCWGNNGQGQLGDGTTTERLTPNAVDLGAGMTAVSVSAGHYHSCAVLNDGSLNSWS